MEAKTFKGVPSVLHMFSPMPHVSPFDITMAYDAGFSAIVPYSNVTPEQVPGLVQDIIFSRTPKDVQRSAIYVGGRDAGLAMDTVDAAKKAMVPPFEVSIFADPSGAFTTSAGLVACVECQLKERHQMELSGARVVIFGGTGPVGVATGVIASLGGANTTIVDYLSIDVAVAKANEYNRRCGTTLRGTYACSDADKARLVSRADVIICTAKAGVQVLDASVLEDAQVLRVAADVNSVPPAGIEGIDPKDDGTPLKHAKAAKGAVGIGPMTIGGVKVKTQKALLHSMLDTEKPVYLDFAHAFGAARILV
ncbi:MAG: NAD(P)-dependent methylenetetrahydromethanopterin dehydrogenase [Rhodothermales bacterium]